MLIICPSCTKSYHIARSTLGGTGRTVQCAKCLSRWHCTGEPAAAEPGTEAAAQVAAHSEAHAIPGEVLATQPPDSYQSTYGLSPRPVSRGNTCPAKSRAPLYQAFAATIVVCAAMGGVAARGAIVAHAPCFASVYAMIGLPVNPRGIAFSDVRSAISADTGSTVLSVEGVVTNLRAGNVTVPEIITSLKSEDGRSIYSWKSPAPKPMLGPGETASFRTRLATPPIGAQTVVLRFANAGEATQPPGTGKK